MPATRRGSGAQPWWTGLMPVAEGKLPQNGREDKISRPAHDQEVNLRLSCDERLIR